MLVRWPARPRRAERRAASRSGAPGSGRAVTFAWLANDVLAWLALACPALPAAEAALTPRAGDDLALCLALGP